MLAEKKVEENVPDEAGLSSRVYGRSFCAVDRESIILNHGIAANMVLAVELYQSPEVGPDGDYWVQDGESNQRVIDRAMFRAMYFPLGTWEDFDRG